MATKVKTADILGIGRTTLYETLTRIDSANESASVQRKTASSSLVEDVWTGPANSKSNTPIWRSAESPLFVPLWEHSRNPWKPF